MATIDLNKVKVECQEGLFL